MDGEYMDTCKGVVDLAKCLYTNCLMSQDMKDDLDTRMGEITDTRDLMHVLLLMAVEGYDQDIHEQAKQYMFRLFDVVTDAVAKGMDGDMFRYETPFHEKICVFENTEDEGE